ncbi:hypothetical protein M0D45_00925 [Xanthomonas prunicola]|uniref:hypothetical protein n=1 Tax=Xanthomonas prunicola TaxID=2053930 RepID=UPI0021B37B51|nr:hypothetical protein [Xanthomonas prunicola]UXA53404.1 hypothetical protein M0D45_00925 [Xanthomonas prunicola]
MNEQPGNSGQLPPDAGSGGDARAHFEVAAKEHGLPLRRQEGKYYWGEVQVAWEMWQAALAARQPVGVEPVVTYCGRRLTPEGTRECWGVLAGGVEDLPIGTNLYTAPPAPAVPVDERQDAAIVEAAKLAYGFLWMGTDLSGPDLAHRARVALRDALGKQACGEGINAARATNPQPAAAKDGPR